MSANLLSQEDYLAIARDLSFPTNAHIDGKFTSSLSGETFPSINPATGEEIAQITSCSKEDVDDAVKESP